MSKELIPKEFTPVIQKYDVGDVMMSQKLIQSYSPFMEEVQEKISEIATLEKGNQDSCDKAKRIAIDLGKICSRLDKHKKQDKEYYLQVGRLIDGVYKVVESTARIAQSQAKEISDYFENIEKERIQKIYDSRLTEISQYTDVIPQNLGLMPDDVFTAYLQGIKIAFTAKLEAEKKAEEEKERKELQLSRYMIAAEYKSFWDREYDFAAMSEQVFSNCIKWLKEQKSKAEAEIATLREQNELLSKKSEELDEAAKLVEEKKELDELLRKSTEEERIRIWINSFSFSVGTPDVSESSQELIKDIIAKADSFKSWALKQI